MIAMNQKTEQVRKWLIKQYPEIKKNEKKATILGADESAIQSVANYARGYATRGVTPVSKIYIVKMHINMISAISNQGKLHFLLYSVAIYSDKLIGFVETIIKNSKQKVYLILDNLLVYHSKKVSAWADDNKKQISLFYLPPYLPEYNPQTNI